MLLFLLVYVINLQTHFFRFLLFFFFILNETTSCKNKMSFPSESDMVSNELQNSDLIYVNLMTGVFKIIIKYRRKIIVEYRHLSPSGNRALSKTFDICVERYLTIFNDNLAIFDDRNVHIRARKLTPKR